MPFNVGPVELIIVLVIALLVVGPRRLPEMGNAVGKTIREFRKASTDITDAATIEPEAKPAPAATASTASPGASAEPASEATSTATASSTTASSETITEAPQPAEAAPAAGSKPNGA